jgi:predicted acetyltransferase
VLVTCDDTNAASRATIERCGGYLDPDRPTFDTGHEIVRRYWID